MYWIKLNFNTYSLSFFMCVKVGLFFYLFLFSKSMRKESPVNKRDFAI